MASSEATSTTMLSDNSGNSSDMDSDNHNRDHFFDHPDMLDETCSEAKSFNECDMYGLDDSMMVEESIIAMHRTMQRSLDNMLLMATELCHGMGMDVSSLHEALEEEGQVQ
ncbi:hypothetical protein V8E53_000752 [Lactarius tabidus]